MGRHTPRERQRELVALWRSCDLSAAAFAREHEVRPGTFLTWIARHPPQPGEVVRPTAFVEVTSARAGPFVVQVGPHALTFPEPPPAAWFAELVRELGAC